MSRKMVKIGIIGGSGLDDPKLISDYSEKTVTTEFGKPESNLTLGKIGGVEVVILARHGKKHQTNPTNVNYRANIRVLKDAGCTHIIATTACGSLREDIRPGDIVFLDQFIDFTKQRKLTFFDKEVVHTPMADPFCPHLRDTLGHTANALKLRNHHEGTVVTIEGPRFSSRAESEMFRKLGADVINMTTVPEVTLAREAGMHYASIAMSTDYDCWKEGEESVSFELVLERMRDNASKVKRLLFEAIPKVGNKSCTCVK